MDRKRTKSIMARKHCGRDSRSSVFHKFREQNVRVHKRTDVSAVDADSRRVPVKYEDTISEDKRRVNLLYLTRKSDPLGIVWDIRHISFTAIPRVIQSLNLLAIVIAYTTSMLMTRHGYWGFSLSQNSADDDYESLQGMELLVTFNL